MKSKTKLMLTTPDLVVLSLLIEKEMHGYQLNLELERREVRDWAGISRPQIYYSLNKLLVQNMIKSVSTTVSLGPERQIYKTSIKGKKALKRELESRIWSIQRTIPPFLTWLVLSIHAKKKTVKYQILHRRNFLEDQLRKEQATLSAIRKDKGPTVIVAALIVELTIKQFELELEWLKKLESKIC